MAMHHYGDRHVSPLAHHDQEHVSSTSEDMPSGRHVRCPWSRTTSPMYGMYWRCVDPQEKQMAAMDAMDASYALPGTET